MQISLNQICDALRTDAFFLVHETWVALPLMLFSSSYLEDCIPFWAAPGFIMGDLRSIIYEIVVLRRKH